MQESHFGLSRMEQREHRPQRLTHIQPAPRFWTTEHVAETPEKRSHRENSGPNATKRQGCCLQQIEERPSPASSYRRGQFLWHGVFRQSLSVSFILSLIYSFKKWRPHTKTMAHRLQVELTSIIMQIWGKKSPIVTHSSKFLPPPVHDIQLNKVLAHIHTSLLQGPLGITKRCTIWVRILRLYPQGQCSCLCLHCWSHSHDPQPNGVHCECIIPFQECRGSIF